MDEGVAPGRDEVQIETILLERLRRVWKDAPAARNLAELSSQAILEGLARCLEAASPGDPPLRLISPSSNLSARYAFGEDLAARCRAMGYSAPASLGYHSFAYGGEDLRRVLNFLLDKIERDADKPDDHDVSLPSDSPEDFPDLDLSLMGLLPKETINAAFNLIQRPRADRVHHNTVDLSSKSPSAPHENNDDLTHSTIVKTEQMAEEQQNRRLEFDCKVPDDVGEFKGDGDVTTGLKEYLELQDTYKDLRDEIRRLHSQNNELAKEVRKQEAELEALESRSQSRIKLLELMPDAENNIQLLETLAEKSRSKVAKLRRQFLDTKDALDKEFNETVTQTDQVEIFAIQQQTEKILELKEDRRRLLEQYRDAYEGLSDVPDVSPLYAYTERILDMMRNIQKQRDETERVIEDIKRSQKDINALEGKLDRTYADLDATLFDRTWRDPVLVPAYQMAVELHTVCNEIVEIVRRKGKARREGMALRDKLEKEGAKNIKEKTLRLEEDLQALKKETKTMDPPL